MFIREFHEGDEPALHRVFLSAIHGLAARDYSQEQVNAWGPKDLDQTLWANRMRGIAPFVMEHEGTPIAYADVQENGYIDHFFVSAPFARQGVGSQLMRRIHERAAVKGMPLLTSEVSRTAQPFFKKFGFVIVAERTPLIRGVPVPNASMEKRL